MNRRGLHSDHFAAFEKEKGSAGAKINENSRSSAWKKVIILKAFSSTSATDYLSGRPCPSGLKTETHGFKL